MSLSLMLSFKRGCCSDSPVYILKLSFSRNRLAMLKISSSFRSDLVMDRFSSPLFDLLDRFFVYLRLEVRSGPFDGFFYDYRNLLIYNLSTSVFFGNDASYLC